MKSLAVGEFKSQFSAVLKEIQEGHPVAITYGRKRTKLAVLVPYDQYVQPVQRQLGLLQNTAACHIHDDFKLSDEDFLKS